MPHKADSPEPRRPDYFDRLLARYTPVTPPATAESAVRVRPRLPGPFERIEVLRADPPGPDEPAPLLPPAAPRPTGRETAPGPAREIRTERHTVVRAEPAEDTPKAAPPRSAAATPPRSRPTAPVTSQRPPAVRPERAETGTRPAGTAKITSGEATRTRAAQAGRTEAPARPLAAPAAALPRPADTAMARRTAARAPAGRRTVRPAEPTVRVQIGRLEVRAAGAAGATGANRATTRPERSGRRAPTVSLADYLSGYASDGAIRERGH